MDTTDYSPITDQERVVSATAVRDARRRAEAEAVAARAGIRNANWDPTQYSAGGIGHLTVVEPITPDPGKPQS